MPDPTSSGSTIPPADPSQGVDIFHDIDTGFSRYVFFFPLNGVSLLGSHLAGIDALAGDLNGGKYFELYALADRSGSQSVNYQVSKGRYNAVVDGLFNAGFEDDPSRFGGPEKILGEDFWAYLQQTATDPTEAASFADGLQSARNRVVVVYLWNDEDSSKHQHADLSLLVYARSVTQPIV
jgi:hypothetical protein